jgi:HAD superfamily hydrolase (TIGR01509 family)
MEMKLKEIGINESARDMLLSFRGNKLGNIISALEIKHATKLDDNFVGAYRELVAQLFEKELKPTEGVCEALDKITNTMCVASSGPIQKIQHALKVTGLTKYFGANLFSSYEIGSWKPEPDLYLFAAKTLGYKPQNCIVVEDSPIGIQAAKAANMTAIYYSPQGASISGAQSIKHMRELRNVIT